MPQSINSFQAGLNRDLSKQLIPKNQYTNLENFRLITSGGYSNGAIENIKGMLQQTTFSDTSPVYKLVIDYNYLENNSPQIVTITVGSAVVTTTISSATTYQSLYNTLVATGTGVTAQADVSYSESQILITYPGKVTGVVIVSTTGNGLLLSLDIPTQTNIHPVGYTQIRDDIYVFTTSALNTTPGITSALNLGQIWKMTYNKLNLNTTLDLIYNNYLDFSLTHPIPNNAATGRYENNSTQKIYWSDNYNPPRTLNVADSQVFATSVENTSIEPIFNGSIPILSEITDTGKDLLVGIYQAAYRLKNTSGGETKFSPVSNLVPILNASETTNQIKSAWIGYTGSPLGTPTTKAIKWQIDNIDTDYDRIEFIVLFRNELSDVPTVIRTHDEIIPDNGFKEFVVDTLNDGVELTLTEFNSFDYIFTTVKTMATKDNRLFFANLSTRKPDINFDARAYRFSSSNINSVSPNVASTVVYDTTNASTTVFATYDPTFNTFSLSNPGDEHDCICPNTLLDSNSGYTDVTKYKLNPSGTSELGGTGTNISYKFGTYCIKGDSSLQLPNIGSNETSPFRITHPRWTAARFDDATGVNLGIQDQSYNIRGTDDGIKFAYRSSILKGYQRNEVYRFGIQFFDKQMRPLYTKWIGDIKMPDYWDTNTNPDPQAVIAGISDFRLSFVGNSSNDGGNSTAGGQGTSWLQVLYIDFEVKIPSNLLNIIEAFDIVRCERSTSDRRILDTGYLTQSILETATDYYLPKVVDPGDGTGGFAFNLPAPYGPTTIDVMTFNGVDAQLLNNYHFAIGDEIRITHRGVYANTTTTQIFPPGVTTNTYQISKVYNTLTPTVTRNNKIENCVEVGMGGLCTINSRNFYNLTRNSATTSATLGNKTRVLKLSTGYSVVFPVESSYETHLAAYYRPVANQYGGNSFSQRSESTYISCGMLQSINSTNVVGSNTVFTLHTFGGDIFTGVFDSTRGLPNWGQTGRGSGVLAKRMMAFYIPTESTSNLEITAGYSVNDSVVSDSQGNNGSTYDAPSYNTVYSCENNIRKYTPKPAEFVDVEEFDNRVCFSQVKINGELRDSWSDFKTNDYYDVEGSYGAINALEVLGSNIHFLQDNAFGVLSINPKFLIPDSAGGEVQIQSGTSKVITRHDYISTEVGCKHQWGITKSGTTLFWFDINNKKFYRFRGQGAEPLSDIKGLSSYFANNLTGNIIITDNPILSLGLRINNIDYEFNAGITATYDFRYNEAIFTFFDYNYTPTTIPGEVTNLRQFKTSVVYNEQIDAFTGFYTHYPKLYINDHISIFSCDPTVSTFANPGNYSNHNLYIHDKGDYGRFYGIINEAKLSLIVNEAPIETKVFDNLQWLSETTDLTTGTAVNVNDDTFQTIRCYNDYQNTDFQLLDPLSLNPNITRKERNWNLAVPRNRVLYTTSNSPDIFTDIAPVDKPYGERLRDKHLLIDLIYNNLNNYRFVFYDIKTQLRISPR